MGVKRTPSSTIDLCIAAWIFSAAVCKLPACIQIFCWLCFAPVLTDGCQKHSQQTAASGVIPVNVWCRMTGKTRKALRKFGKGKDNGGKII
jgi:hypothetical protein